MPRSLPRSPSPNEPLQSTDRWTVFSTLVDDTYGRLRRIVVWLLHAVTGVAERVLGDWYPGRALAELIGVALVGIAALLNSRS
jgi:hypothetical protein